MYMYMREITHTCLYNSSSPFLLTHLPQLTLLLHPPPHPYIPHVSLSYTSSPSPCSHTPPPHLMLLQPPPHPPPHTPPPHPLLSHTSSHTFPSPPGQPLSLIPTSETRRRGSGPVLIPFAPSLVTRSTRGVPHLPHGL